MRYGIVGSRNFTDYYLMVEVMGNLTREDGHIGIVSGGAKGADTLAEKYAERHEASLVVHKPNTAKYGWPAAAFERNTTIADEADVLVVFFGPDQPPMRGDRKFGSGTMDTVQKAMRMRKPVHIYFQKEDS